MVKIKKINESYLQIICDADLAMDISDCFAFYVEGYQWSPKYKSGIWDGRIKLFNIRNRLMPIGLYDDLIIYFNQRQIEYKNEVENIYGPKLSAKFINEFCNEILKCDLKLRDYQINAIQQAFKNKKIILLSATGSGKSFILFLIINLLKYMDDNFKFLLVVPTSSLVYQMREDFIEYGKNFSDYNDYIHIIEGKKKNSSKPIIITTWQAIMEKRIPSSWFVKFNGICIDECHTAQATQLSKIVNNCINAQFKFGMTGSLKESNTSKMQLKSLFSKVFLASKTKDLQKKKILSQLKIRNCILEYPTEYRNICKSLNYVEETNYIRSLEIRKKFILNLSKKVKGNTLILFKIVDYGKEIFEMIKKENKNTYFIYGGTKVKDRELVRKITENNDKVIIVASFPVFSQGVNIKKLHNLIFAESVKSSIKVIQSIGRTLRLHDSKDCAILYDLVDEMSYKKRKNFVLRHFLQRIKIYDHEQFNYTTKTFKLE